MIQLNDLLRFMKLSLRVDLVNQFKLSLRRQSVNLIRLIVVKLKSIRTG